MPSITPQEILDLMFYTFTESGIAPYVQVAMALMFVTYFVRRIFGNDD